MAGLPPRTGDTSLVKRSLSPSLSLEALGSASSTSLVVVPLGPTGSARAIAQELMGPSIPVANVVLTGATAAIGTFDRGLAVIGLERGILLSSGAVARVVGPNQSDSATVDWGRPGDADLTALVGVNTYDALALTFDFVPSTSSLTFQFVFGSEEYNEYVNTSFNDVFGIFVNGRNCAEVGDPRGPVTVNRINNGNPLGTAPRLNHNLYRNNDLSDGGGSFETEMDGLTVALSCTTPVKRGVTNRLKIAIADASDHAWDSNVFLALLPETAPPPPPLPETPALRWPLPGVAGVGVTQGFADFDGIGNGKYHTGLDIKAPLNTQVYAAASGTIHMIQENRQPGCPGSGSCDHGFGNTVVLRHQFATKTVYTQYSHLNSIAKSIRDKCPAVDARGRASCSVPIASGDPIGGVGGTGEGKADRWPIHLHFEMKSVGTLCFDPANNEGCGSEYGYTWNRPDGKRYREPNKDYGYSDPVVYLHQTTAFTSPIPVVVQRDKALLRYGPGSVNSTPYSAVDSLIAGEPFLAKRSAPGTTAPDCPEGWLQVGKEDNARIRLNDGSYTHAAWTCITNVVTVAHPMIDIQPDGISLKGTPAVNVVLVSSGGVNATAIDGGNVRLVIDGRLPGARVALRGGRPQQSDRDWNNDGRMDRVFTFRTADLITAGLTTATTDVALLHVSGTSWAARDLVMPKWKP